MRTSLLLMALAFGSAPAAPSDSAETPAPAPTQPQVTPELAGPVPPPPAADAGRALAPLTVTPEQAAAVAKGLAWLAANQGEDGSWTSKIGYKLNEDYKFTAADRGHVGVTALAGMAFLAGGHLPGRGEYGTNVERCLDFVLGCVDDDGYVSQSGTRMYSHAFATLFLAEIYGMTDDDDVRDALVKAVKLIVKSQNAEGGWRYQPIPYDADLSVTICQIKALRSARQAGIDVPKETIEKAIQYVKDSQNPYDGGFRYMIGSGSSAFPRSAAGVASLYYAGVYEGDIINDGIAYLEKQIDSGNDDGGHEFYGHYYCSQAMFIAGGKHWADYFPMIRERMIRRQERDGSWDSPHGKDYATGMTLIVLEMPYRLLPIFQR